MELRHIRYFLEVAEHLNFSRAAERLKIAQPALSKQIKDLETELGGKLFHRTTSKVSLTEMGVYFRQQTQRIMMQLDIAATGAQQIAQGTSGTLKVGCDWKTIGLPIAPAARLFRKSHPRIQLEFVEMPVAEHVRAIRDHQMDVAFVPSFLLGNTEDLELRFLCSVRLKIILPNDHPLAPRKRLTLDDIKNERILALDADSIPGFRLIMAQILKFQPKYGLSTASMPSLIAHVNAGHGIGVVPYWGYEENSEGLTRVDIDCAPLEFYVVALRGAAHPSLPDYLEILEALLARQRSKR
jgi:LysR family transcriptional regulator, benzoate and cis,cis-muconate-responsive activator of ben and cat genes